MKKVGKAHALAILLLGVGMAGASPATDIGGVAAWRACEKRTAASSEAKELEDVAGRTAVVQFVFEQCGYRPVMMGRNGRRGLAEPDCQELFSWAVDGVCSVENTVGLDLSARTLDPRVFDRMRYEAWCERSRTGGTGDRYRSFRNQVCEGQRPRK